MQTQYVTNGTHTYGVVTEIQLSSFLNSGFTIVDNAPTIEVGKPTVSDIKYASENAVIATDEPIIYTRTIINRMNVETLKELAIKSGLEIGLEESGSSLKKRLIELFIK